MDNDFIALKTDGSVVVWGSSYVSPSVAAGWAAGVTDVVANKAKFVAVKADGSAVVGPGGPGTDLAPHLTAGITKVVAAPEAFTFFKTGGSIVCWSTSNSSYVGTQVFPGTIRKIVTSQNRFTALMEDGSAVTWGANVNSWTQPPAAALSSGVLDVFGHANGFEVTKSDGSVIAWGAGGSGKVPAADLTFVNEFAHTLFAGVALKADGSVVAWGSAVGGGSTYGVARELESSVATRLFGNTSAFAALIETPRVYVDPPTFEENLVIPSGHVLSVPLGRPGEGFTFSLAAGDGDTGNAKFSVIGDRLVPLQPLDHEATPVVSVRVRAQGQLGTTAETVLSLKIINNPADDAGPVYGVVAFGNRYEGGDASLVAEDLRFGVKEVYATRQAFAAVKRDGRVFVWGAPDAGGNQAHVPAALSLGLRKVVPNYYKDFVALTSFGEVLAWGTSTTPVNGTYPATSTHLNHGITEIVANGLDYVALSADGRIRSDHPFSASNMLALAGGCRQVLSTTSGFVALTHAGAVVVWGSGSLPDTSALQHDIVSVERMGAGFAALKLDGSKIAFGTGIDFAVNAVPAKRVAKLVSSTLLAGASLLTDGSVIRLGGGAALPAGLGAGVSDLFGNDGSAFAALKTDGSAIVWGDAARGGSAAGVDLSGGVVRIVAGSSCFAALKRDGSVVAWGLAADGGDSSLVAAELSGGVSILKRVSSGFVAVKTNGRVVIWGNARNNVDFATLEKTAQGRAVDVIATQSAFAALVVEPPPTLDWAAEPISENSVSQLAGRFSVLGARAGESYQYSLVAGIGDVDNTRFRIQGDRLLARLTPDHEVLPVARVRVRLQGNGVTIVEKAILLRIDDDFSPLEAETGHHVVTWGLAGFSGAGGSSAAVAADLSSGVAEVIGVGGGFLARKLDGSAIGWGNSAATTNVPAARQGVRRIFGTTYGGWAALKDDRSVISWGDAGYGGSGNQMDVVDVIANETAFAAVKRNGSVVAWGSSLNGGNPGLKAQKLQSGVVRVVPNNSAFAALKWDGSVVTWGSDSDDADTTAVALALREGVVEISAANDSFAALKNDGSVISWGDSSGGASAVAIALSSGVKRVFATGGAFAALKEDGSVVTWGIPIYGGDSSAVASGLSAGVKTIFCNDYAFAALKSNGAVVTWGRADSGGSSAAVSGALSSGVTTISAAEFAFAALKSNGSVVTWGSATGGGNSSSTAGSLGSGVVQVAAGDYAFAAVKSNGSVVTWGEDSWGGDSSLVASALRNVSSVVSSQVCFAALIPDPTISPGAVTVPENLPVGSVVATLTANSVRAGEIMTFSLASDQTVAVTENFQILGDQLVVKASPDFEHLPFIEIRISATGTMGTSISSVIAVTVLDQSQDNFTAWLDAASLAGSRRAAAADPDGDGISNLMEFVTGSDPLTADTADGPLRLEAVDGYFRAEFFLNPAARHIQPRVQFGEMLSAWTDAADVGGEIAIDTFAGNGPGGCDRVVVWIPATATGRMFVRLAADFTE